MAGHATITCDEFLDLAAVVALDAADVEDVQRVEDHAAQCAECRARSGGVRVGRAERLGSLRGKRACWMVC